MRDTIAIRRATAADLESVSSLLEEAGIRSMGLDKWIESFIVAETVRDHQAESAEGHGTEPPHRRSSEIVATAGLEQYDSKGLLRSLVIRSKAWSAEDGLRMLQLVLAYAEETGFSELYLLTESPSLFIHMGFAPVACEEVAPELLESLHFRQHRERAVPMRKVLQA
ncbi:hypothetical protein EFBL_1214 [Effusibacillus lacus]|uniref:N-acetyltransferase domain-containing protein n=2 Tax=Effusibacillus lacus TaxID=1348429 RepID=A0A292YM89_9BACL|nr:N-acetylglutamate synthase-like GNAT family acetyltransferase [Effusibacillus lacus]GAX89590.1 hypothetical protein EFBL_1214 [Effusibacillus lacus]